MARRVETLPLVISSVGLSEKDRRALALAIEFAEAHDAPCRYAGDDSHLGHLVVIDIDSEAGRQVLSRLSTEQIKLLFASERITGENIVSLVKPVKFQLLKPIIIKMAKDFQTSQSKANGVGCQVQQS